MAALSLVQTDPRGSQPACHGQPVQVRDISPLTLPLPLPDRFRLPLAAAACRLPLPLPDRFRLPLAACRCRLPGPGLSPVSLRYTSTHILLAHGGVRHRRVPLWSSWEMGSPMMMVARCADGILAASWWLVRLPRAHRCTAKAIPSGFSRTQVDAGTPCDRLNPMPAAPLIVRLTVGERAPGTSWIMDGRLRVLLEAPDRTEPDRTHPKATEGPTAQYQPAPTRHQYSP
jgi:hypothetical protein